jgi:hypothetical protein
MSIDFKNTIAALLITTANVVSGAGIETENTSTGASSSIADGLIRHEVSSLIKDMMSTLTTERDNAKVISAAQTLLNEFNTFLRSSTNELEQRFLRMHINGFSALPDVLRSPNRSNALQNLFESLRSEQEDFIQKALKSDKLRELVLQMMKLSQEKISLENQPERVEEIAVNKANTLAVSKELLALYDDKDIDSQTKKEFDALDQISILPKELLDTMRNFAYPKTALQETDNS